MNPIYKTLIILLMAIIMSSCSVLQRRNSSDINQVKKDIIGIEQQFAEMVKTDGMSKAFVYFAAEDAVLNRNDVIIDGKSNIKEYLSKGNIKDEDISLVWETDFVGVSESGDMAYTYGKYTFSLHSSKEKPKTGIFHTIWKRQSDGSWKYVWD